jgi:hypothetical protein
VHAVVDDVAATTAAIDGTCRTVLWGMCPPGRWTRPTQLIAALNAPLTRLPATRAALTRLSTRLPAAGREPDSDGRSLVIAVARDGSGAPLARAGARVVLAFRNPAGRRHRPRALDAGHVTMREALRGMGLY